MKKLISLLAIGVLFSACNGIEGQLAVNSSFSLKNSDNASVTIKEGQYKAVVDQVSSKKINLKIDGYASKFPITVPKNSIPDNGDFKVGSAVSGQPVDVAGTVKTDVQDTYTRRVLQSCFYQRPVEVCMPIPNGGVTCRVDMRTFPGSQWVDYRDRTTTQDIALNILTAKSENVLADFSGRAVMRERMIVNQTPCM